MREDQTGCAAGHEFEAVCGIPRANKHRISGLACDVEAPVKTVGRVDIYRPRWAEHGGMTQGEAPDAVGGLIILP